MKPTDRQKMCVSCDGRVPFEAIVCPYCSTDMAKAPEIDPARDAGAKHQAIQDSLTSLYTPPYQQKASKGTETKTKKAEKAKAPAAEEERFVPPAHLGGVPAAAVTRDPAQEKDAKSVLISILALSLGSLLFILGILQIFFAEDGVLRLEWDASRWFIYCLAALPLLYYGYRKIEERNA